MNILESENYDRNSALYMAGFTSMSLENICLNLHGCTKLKG